jgi:hypothetical protein
MCNLVFDVAHICLLFSYMLLWQSQLRRLLVQVHDARKEAAHKIEPKD